MNAYPNKIAMVIRTELQIWQKLNVASLCENKNVDIAIDELPFHP